MKSNNNHQYETSQWTCHSSHSPITIVLPRKGDETNRPTPMTFHIKRLIFLYLELASFPSSAEGSAGLLVLLEFLVAVVIGGKFSSAFPRIIISSVRKVNIASPSELRAKGHIELRATGHFSISCFRPAFTLSIIWSSIVISFNIRDRLSSIRLLSRTVSLDNLV